MIRIPIGGFLMISSHPLLCRRYTMASFSTALSGAEPHCSQLIVKFGGPTVRSALDNRSKRISHDIDEAARLYEEAGHVDGVRGVSTFGSTDEILAVAVRLAKRA